MTINDDLIYPPKLTPQQKRIFRLYTLFVFLVFSPMIILFFSAHISDSDMTWKEGLVIFLVFGFLILIGACNKRPNPVVYLYKNNIVQKKKGKETIHRTYEEIEYIECLHYVYKTNKYRTSEDRLIFWFPDASYICLALKVEPETLWEELISIHPDLAKRLIYCVDDKDTQQLYHRLNNVTLKRKDGDFIG